MKPIALLSAALALIAAPLMAAETFEIIEPEVEEGAIELEFLSTVALDGAEETRSAHEIGIGYGITDFWSASISIEIENPRGEGLEVEGFEFENTFALIGGGDDDDDRDGDEAAPFALALYAAIEVPEDEGFDEAELAVGPTVGFGAGQVELIGNLFLEIPFEDGEDPGLLYAASAVVEVTDAVGLGFEAHGEIEEAFGGDSEHALFIGPAIYGEIEAGEAEIETRAALLFGVDEAETDVALSINFEIEF